METIRDPFDNKKMLSKRIAPGINPVKGAINKITMGWTSTSAGKVMNAFILFAHVLMAYIPEEP
jgi:hypothetical protein